MAQIVLEYQESDGHTYSCTNTHPIEYESTEALSVDFEKAMRKGLADQVGEVQFAGYGFYPQIFFYVDTSTQAMVYDEPCIWTIDEWFNHYK
jgi:hypothetical protein